MVEAEAESSYHMATIVAFFQSPPMAMQFLGSLDNLKDKLLPLNLDGDWEEQPNKVWKLRCRDRSGLNWSETKGTLWCDGPGPAKTVLESRIDSVLNDGVAIVPVAADATIFVVHGRDHESRDQLELILRRLGLAPFVLQVTGGGGDTLIEALEKQIGKGARSSFGIVLVTPDDLGRLKTEKPEEDKPRARQNVIMEMGMLLSSLTRKALRYSDQGFCRNAVKYGRRNHHPVQ